jgi:hypothetical protein
MPEQSQPPSTQEVRARLIHEIQDVTGTPRWALVVGTLLAFALMCGCASTIVGIPFAIKMFLNWRRGQNSDRSQMVADALAFAQHAELVMAFPVMVNPKLLQPGNTDPAPGLVLITFDPAVTTKQMANLVVHLTHPPAGWSAEDRSFAESLLNDEQFRAHRRRAVPRTLTQSRDIYACDFALAPQLMPGGYLREECPFVPALAEPGQSGRILHLAWWILSGGSPPDEDSQAAALAMAMAINKMPHGQEQK